MLLCALYVRADGLQSDDAASDLSLEASRISQQEFQKSVYIPYQIVDEEFENFIQTHVRLLCKRRETRLCSQVTQQVKESSEYSVHRRFIPLVFYKISDKNKARDSRHHHADDGKGHSFLTFLFCRFVAQKRNDERRESYNAVVIEKEHHNGEHKACDAQRVRAFDVAGHGVNNFFCGLAWRIVHGFFCGFAALLVRGIVAGGGIFCKGIRIRDIFSD